MTALASLTLSFMFAPPPPCPSPGLDTDGDRISDCVELRTGTDPYDADSDADGVPDGVEDANRDGIVDPGESDPRTPGLFPGASPHIPEPMVFDLVRGLGAKKGEVEANVLLLFPVGGTPEWAPEIEWAFADGAAIELELPMYGGELESLKLAAQLTLPRRRPISPSFIQGFQAIAEKPLHDHGVELTALYLGGYRFSSMGSVMWMVGARAQTAMLDPITGLQNLGLFLDADERVTVGLETNLAVNHLRSELLVMPQVHLQLGPRFRLQMGAGLQWTSDGGTAVMFAARPILE
jgi:hypothetical protein